MQTFLPIADFDRSAMILDRLRLNKQRLECKQILMSLTGGGGWKHHPAVKMWEGYELSLCDYSLAICEACNARGIADNVGAYNWFADGARTLVELNGIEDAVTPPWFGNAKFHRAHRSNLVRKNSLYYRRFFKTVPDDLPYVWPTKEGLM